MISLSSNAIGKLTTPIPCRGGGKPFLYREVNGSSIERLAVPL